MDHLAIYVAAVFGKDSRVVVVREQAEEVSWAEADCTVNRWTRTYWFDNGVVLQRVLEQDDFPSGLACAESIIDYEILSCGIVTDGIQPMRKSFDNMCRESFWLTYHMAG